MAKDKKKTGDNGNGNGNGGKGPSLFHPSNIEDEPSRVEPLPEPEARDEYHLDHQGRKRLFRLRNYERGPFSFFEALEVRNGDPTGWRFAVHYDPESGIVPWAEIREKIRQRLATRDIVRDPDSGGLRVLANLIRAQVGCAKDARKGPPLIVDGETVTWREFGQLLSSYEGWGLRIQITNGGDE